GVAGDAGHLFTCLVDSGRRVDPDDAPVVTSLEGESGDHSRVGGSRNGAHDDVIEEDVVFLLLLGDLLCPVGEAEPAQRMVRGTRRNRVRLAAVRLDRFQSPLPAVPNADVEAGRVDTDVTSQNAGQLDVADLVVERIRPVDPVLLDGHRAQPEVRGDSGDLARVVGLDAADRHERVASLLQRVRDEILELADLVATEGDSGVAVLPLRPDLHFSAERLAQPGQRMDRGRPEEQLYTGIVV